MVSVSCVAYNHESYIKDAIEGFLLQKTDFPIEIFVHDDASADRTADIIREYEKKYPELITGIYQTVNQYSQGKKPSPEFVWPRCRGKYIAVCDGDDYWTDPYKLQKQVDFLESNPEYGLVYGDVDSFYEKNKKYLKSKNRSLRIATPSGHVFEELLLWGFIPALTVLFRKELWDRFAASEDKKFLDGSLIGDYVLWLKFSQETKFYYMDEVLGVYREIEESMIHSRDAKKRIKMFECQSAIRSYFIGRYGCRSETQAAITTDYNRLLLRERSLMCEHEKAKSNFSNIAGPTFDDYLYLAGSRNILFLFLIRVLIKLKRPWTA